jgi:putrescine transport system permease protein
MISRNATGRNATGRNATGRNATGRNATGRPRFVLTVLAFGYAFLYLPIVLVMAYSFNESKMVTVWSGFSFKWWSALFENEDMLAVAWLSLQIALTSATLAAVLGLAAGYVLARVPSFFGRTLFGSLVIAPMVMPEVVMGISMLLLFVGANQLMDGPQFGFLTITIAHTTFSLAFVAIVVQARLADFDRSLEEAAMDLGATPWVTFLTVTLPLIAPAIGSGWLLAFTLSLDDLIMTQFVAGAQSQTLPMLVYSKVRLGVDPQINVLATIVVCVAATALIISGRLTRRR